MSDPSSFQFTENILDLIFGFGIIVIIYFGYKKYLRNTVDSDLESIKKLKALKDDGLITDAEYEHLKGRLLKSIDSKLKQ